MSDGSLYFHTFPSSGLPNLFGRMVRGRLPGRTASLAPEWFPLLYKEARWLFLRLQRGEEEILKEEVSLQGKKQQQQQQQAGPC